MYMIQSTGCWFHTVLYTNKNRGRQLTVGRTRVCNRKMQKGLLGTSRVGMDLWRSKGEPPSVSRNRGRAYSGQGLLTT